jgi:hypothetical protein
MKLYVEQMDSTVVEVSSDGRVRYEAEGDLWHTPTFQERRAILYAAEKETEALAELLEILSPPTP